MSNSGTSGTGGDINIKAGAAGSSSGSTGANGNIICQTGTNTSQDHKVIILE